MNANQPPSVTKIHFGQLFKKNLRACSGDHGGKPGVNVLLLKACPLDRAHLNSTREMIVSHPTSLMIISFSLLYFFDESCV